MIGETLRGWLGGDQFLTAGLSLVVFGYLFNVARGYLLTLWYRLVQELFITVTISSADESFNYISHWITLHEYTKRARSVQTHTKYDTVVDEMLYTTQKLQLKPEVLLVPATGTHVLSYRGKWIWFHRSKEEGDGTRRYRPSGGASLIKNEKITLTCFSRDRTLIEALIKESVDSYFKKDEGQTVLFAPVSCGWQRVTSRMSRPFSTVVLDKGFKTELLNDVREFMSSSSWYRKQGIPYRRGYLLHGPPGCGKTSIIFALAGKIHYNVSVVSLSNGMTDAKFSELMNTVKTRSIVLMEDIDAIFVQREKTKGKDMVSFSGLLNAIDGILSQEGRILFLTTNHIDRLDPALIRPGRVDRSFLFDLASSDQIRRMFFNMYNTCGAYTEDLADRFVRSIPDRTISPATLQGHFLCYKDDPVGATENAPSGGQDE